MRTEILEGITLSQSPSIPHKLIQCRRHLIPRHGCCTHPGEDGEERECDGCSRCIPSLIHWVVLFFWSLPLVGQKAEANEPQECPKGWDGPPPVCQRGRGETSRRYVRTEHKHIMFLWKLQPYETHQCVAGWAKLWLRSLCKPKRAGRRAGGWIVKVTIGVCRKYLRRVHSLVFGLITGLAFGLAREPEGRPVQERSPGLSETATASQPCAARTANSNSFQGSCSRVGSSRPAAAQSPAFAQDSAGWGTHTEERCWRIVNVLHPRERGEGRGEPRAQTGSWWGGVGLTLFTRRSQIPVSRANGHS